MEKYRKENNRTVGFEYEQAAGEYLAGQGLKIIKFNYRCPIGEIDIIADDAGCLVFCEVKYRRSGRMGGPLEAVGTVKQNQIAKCARFYLMENELTDIPCRFDVIGVQDDKITHIRNAFFAPE